MSKITQIYSHYRAHSSVVSTDSRRDLRSTGGVFFALSGERFDGNDFAFSALGNGASMAVVDRASMEGIDCRIVVVDNVLDALQAVASLHRENLKCPVIGLTGSNGKTTTKELIVRVLSQGKRVGATRGNLNNHIGVPLTLLSMDEDIDVAVVEMGANHIGEIERLCRIARPTIGLITNVGVAHLEGFGSVEGVRKAKGELYDYLVETDGVILYNADDKTLRSMVEEREQPRSVGYTGASFGINDVELDEQGFLRFNFRGQAVNTSIVGLYNVNNISAAMALGQLLGIDGTMAMAMIASYESTNNRSQRIDTKFNTLIMDAYNANPSSMRSAIENFAALPLGGRSSKVLILGDMKELGAESVTLHKELIQLALASGIEQILGVGEHLAMAIERHAQTRHEYENVSMACLASAQELSVFLKGNPLRNKMILIKGSRSVGLEVVVDSL